MIGLLVKLVLAVLLVGAGAAAVLTVTGSPAACTPDVQVPASAEAFARRQSFVDHRAPASVTSDEGDATAVLRDRLSGQGLPLRDPVVHFCKDGSAQVSFSAPAGPATIKALATGTVAATSPLWVQVTGIGLGGLPRAVTDPLGDALKDPTRDTTSLGLEGAVKTVVITEGKVRITK
jgi:hypothetical protein